MPSKRSTGVTEPTPALSPNGGMPLCDAKFVTLGDAAAETQFRALLDVLPAAIYVTDAAGRITYYNQAAADLAGREPKLGTDEWCVSWRLYTLDGRLLPHDQCPMAIALKENRAVRGERAILERPDGTRIQFAPYPTPLRDASGKLIGAVNMLVDLTDSSAKEAALNESEKRLLAELDAARQLQEVSTQLLQERGSEALYQKILDAAASTTRSDFASMQMFHPERGEKGELQLLAFRGFDPEAAKFWEWVRADSGCTCGMAMRTGTRAIAANVETCDFMAGTDDRTAYLRASIYAAQSTPLISRSGRLLGMISTHWRKPHTPSESDLLRLDVLARLAADLIERSQAEAALQQSEARFRTMVSQVIAGISQTDLTGRFVHTNERYCEMVGYSAAELSQMRVQEITHPEDLPRHLEMLDELARSGTGFTIEKRYIRKDGSIIWVSNSVSGVRDATGQVTNILGVSTDVSERRAAEDARAYLAAIVQSSDDAIVSKTLEGIVTSWNDGAEAIFGFTAEEMIGQPITRLFPPDRLFEEDVILERVRRGEKVDHFETVRRRKDGRDIDVSVTISPVRDGTGRIVGASKIGRDITEKKRAEAALRDLNEKLEQRVTERTHELAEANNRLLTETAERERTEAELLQARKMEAIGQLVSGLAHDFNNLLAAILGNLELLEMRLSDPHLMKLVQAAARSARHGAKLNEQMLAFSRKQYLSPVPVDLNELVLGTQDLLRRSLGGTVEVSTALSEDLWPALVDPHQLELVLLNLAINARDAMPAGGRVVIKTRNFRAGERNRPVELPAGDYVMISVADSGTGMSPDVLARACEPFFTTKEPGKGSGLGLAQVYGLAQQSGGGMRITSAVGKGTTVTVYLPRSLAEPRRAAEAADAAERAALSRRTRVLVVDDNEDVREVIVAYLDALGYQSLQAASGSDALALLADTVGGVDLLLADYAMPGMSGAELARRVSGKWPELPVIVITGYADATGFDGQLDEAVLLRKPFGINELGSAIEHAMLRQRAAAKPGKVVRLRPRAAG